MKIGEFFKKDINRPINGVIKAEQLDKASVWQELEEFVLTKELYNHFDRFFSSYSDSLERKNDPDISGKIGVWVSGFFGSGKSHFIKALYYLLGNQTVSLDGESKTAFDFFEEKIHDSMLVGTVKHCTNEKTDVILFNIDSKADQSKGRDAIVKVFLKVLNELQGYSPDYPHIAHMERYLDKNDKFDSFKKSFNEVTGCDWVSERDTYMFKQDEVVKALSQTLEESEESCHRWIDHAESDFSLTIENFSKWTKEYLDSKGGDHRIIFFVDEIGQFIGQDGHLMLNLQTIVENLGVTCNGRAWVVVTAQEDIDKVLGSMSKARGYDFSKIQGRFKTRLSLSSANVDEVIQKRLIEKTPESIPSLSELYSGNADILKNQLAFSNVSATLPSYRDDENFIKNYPFIPYQFVLLQKVFETIRRAGATGLHLARGERSMLDAFQYAGMEASKKELGTLVPMYWFYPSVENFLDTSVKRTIDQAAENPALHEFDSLLLKTLFMIRYIEEIKGNVDNLVTLCIDRIDTDRVNLKREIESSIHRLEREHLVGRSGEDYFFLTNEEREISREISNVELEFNAETRMLAEIIYSDIYKDNRKHRYSKTGKDLDLLRLCDRHVYGGSIESGLIISAISQFCDDYSFYDKARCTMESSNDGGQVSIKLPENEQLANEIIMYLKTAKYISRKSTTTNPEAGRILNDRGLENRQRRTRLMEIVKEMLAEADFYAAGSSISLDGTEPLGLFSDALDYLVDNTFSKMNYIEHPSQDPKMETQAVLRSNDIGQQTLNLDLPKFNPKATAEVREHIDLCTRTSKQMILFDLVTDKFTNRPYAWPEWETMLILARLIVAGEIQFMMHGDILETRRIFEIINKTSNWRKVTIKQRKSVDTALVEKVRKTGQELFNEMGPDTEDMLFEFYQKHLNDWHQKLSKYKTLADTGSYPGSKEIDQGLRFTSLLLNDKDSYTLINRVKEIENDLLEFSDEFNDVDNFYNHQKNTWDRLKSEYGKFELNRFELEKDPDAAAALRRMQEILSADSPYNIIKEADSLVNKVSAINDSLVSAVRSSAIEDVEVLLDSLSDELKEAGVDKSFEQSCLAPLLKLKTDCGTMTSIAHLQQVEPRAQAIFEQQLQKLTDYMETQTADEPEVVKPKIKQVVTVKVSSIAGKDFIESKDQIEKFISNLQQKLQQEIDSNHRVRID